MPPNNQSHFTRSVPLVLRITDLPIFSSPLSVDEAMAAVAAASSSPSVLEVSSSPDAGSAAASSSSASVMSSPDAAALLLPRRCALVIGLDGCRPDCLTAEIAPTLWGMMHQQHVVPPALPLSDAAPVDASPVLPSTAGLPLHCAYSLRSQVGDICWSGPGWTSACTGVWRNKHGVSGNLFPTQQFASYPVLFQRLKTARPESVTACAVNWAPLAEHVLLPADHSITHEDNDALVLDAAQSLLREQPRLDLMFVHLDLVDHVGHQFDYGPAIPEYVAAVRETDARVAALLATLRSGERRWVDQEDWLVAITTDHGGIDYTHEDSRPENRTNFLILQGTDVVRGEIFPAPLVVDVAPTVLAHLRVPLRSSWNLDGRPVGLKLSDPLAGGLAGCFMDLTASQDPLNLFPILPEELEAGPSPDVPIDDIAAEAAKLKIAQRLEA